VGEEIAVDREMGCTRQEFLGWLPGATRGAPFEVKGDLVTIHPGAGTVQIRLIEAAPRRLGLLCVPVLRVSILFQGLQASGRAEFLRQFDLFTRRGGG
jgi:hypothetical protein